MLECNGERVGLGRCFLVDDFLLCISPHYLLLHSMLLIKVLVFSFDVENLLCDFHSDHPGPPSMNLRDKSMSCLTSSEECTAIARP